MIKEIKSTRLGILVDTGHINLNGENPSEALMKLNGLPLHIHIDDNNGNVDTHLIPGEGNIQFEPFVNTLKKINYGGFVSVELGFQYTVNPDNAAKRSMKSLIELFGS